MKTIEGDLLKLAKAGQFDVIIHGCNCFCIMGGGIAHTISNTFPEAYNVDKMTQRGDKSKLGNYTSVEIESPNGNFIIVNAYTQYDISANSRAVSYSAVKQVFKKIKKDFSGKRIGYPAIGAGLAGGDWDIISEIINYELQGEDHTFVKFKP